MPKWGEKQKGEDKNVQIYKREKEEGKETQRDCHLQLI